MVDNLKNRGSNLKPIQQTSLYQHQKKVALLICCKYIGSTSTVDNVAAESMDLTLLFSWFTGPTERREAAAGADLEGSSAASIYESKQDNASGTTP